MRQLLDRLSLSRLCIFIQLAVFQLPVSMMREHVCVRRSADDNLMTEVEPSALEGLQSLRTLRLARNRLRAPPADALASLARLQYL